MNNKYLRGALVGLALGATGLLGYKLADGGSREELYLREDSVERIESSSEIKRNSETEIIDSRPYQDETNKKISKKERDLISENVPSLEKVLSEYVPRSWVEEESSFYMTAIEQLIGSTGVYGLVKLFEDLKVEDSSLIEGKRVWVTKGGRYEYHKADGRHHLEVKSDDGSISLNYQIMTDDVNSLSGVIGERWTGKKNALSYTIRPGEIRYGGAVTLGASRYTGREFFGHPLWEDWRPRNENDTPKTSGETLFVLKNKKLDEIFGKFKAN